VTDNSGASVPDQALVNDAPADHHPSGFDPSREFIIKRWCVAVSGYGTGRYDAASRGKAIADAWRCDAFGHLRFGEFLKIVHCWRDHDVPARWGDPIVVGGKPAFFLENNSQYVRFTYPDSAIVSNAHPYDVLPVQYRPDNYRGRDSDGHPEGGDGTAPSRSDDSAGPQDIAQP